MHSCTNFSGEFSGHISWSPPDGQITIVANSSWPIRGLAQKERIMKIKLRNAWASTLVAFAATLTVTAGIVVASSASATTPSSTSHQTCTFYHAHLGPTHYAVNPYTARSLAWTAIHPSTGEPLSLERYRDTVNQCMWLRFGFGHGMFEIWMSTGTALCLTENPITHQSGVPLELQACRSRRTQLFVDYGAGRARNRFELVASPRLCIASDTAIQSGAVLYQENCNDSSQRQHWWINTNP
jgi:Ricin-type beta-trefoil lectin domain